MVQRIKRINVDSIPIPKSRDFDLPNKYKFLEDGETSMLFWDSGKEDPRRILLFATDKTISYLKTVKHGFTDSTFKASPEIFFQMYAFHGLVGASTVPLIIGFTTNKMQDTYERIYGKIQGI